MLRHKRKSAEKGFHHHEQIKHFSYKNLLPYLRESNVPSNLMRTLKPKKVFAGECNAHWQKVHSLQQ
jgi:hypothetical protein